MRRPSAAALVSWSLVAVVARAALADAQTLPRPTGKVGDFAGVLTPTARTDLQSLLTTLEKDTTAEVVVATTASLGGMSVEEYGNRVFNEWRIGKAALDNGVLVLVAPTERQIRIEVGYGLEGVIPDALAGAIIRDDFLPGFRDGNYEAGILKGVRRVADVVRAKQVVTSEQLEAPVPSSRPDVFLWIVFAAMAAMWLAHYEKFWRERLDALGRYLFHQEEVNPWPRAPSRKSPASASPGTTPSRPKKSGRHGPTRKR